ncbi:hypothetical protein V6N13_079011 [Hibiscus sabdariffa]
MLLLVESVRAASGCLWVLSSFNFSFLGFISDLVAEIQGSAFDDPGLDLTNTQFVFDQILSIIHFERCVVSFDNPV